MTKSIRRGWLGGPARAALIVALLWALPVGAQQATLGPGLTQTLAGLAADEAIEVVVSFEGDEIADAQIAALQSLGIEDGVALQELPIALVVATAAQIESLAALPGVRSIWPNHEITLYNDRATLVTGVDRVRTSNALRVKNGGMPVSGDGVGIFINDSGIDATHPDLQLGRNVVQNVHYVPRVHSGIQPAVYAEDVPNTDSNSGHGTHVAGTAGGTGAASGTKHEGVAPGANIVGCTSGSVVIVLFSTLSCYDYMLAHQVEHRIRVMNNSFGPLNGGRYDPNSPTAIANKKAYDRSIVVVFAAGNDGPGDNTLNPYAEDPFTLGVAAGIVDGRLASFSSRGIPGHALAKPDITAPGEDIISARASTVPGSESDRLTVAEMTYYTPASGTSMAAPHAAGIVALMLEANPLLSVDEVKEILSQTATNMPGLRPHEVGSGYINAFAAVQEAFDRATPFGSTVVAAREFNATDACTLSDVQGHPLVKAMITAVSTHALDGFEDGTFRPDEKITRATLAQSLLFAMETRQFIPLDGSHTFTDVSTELRPFAEAVAARGAAMRDMEHEDGGVLHTTGAAFDPEGRVTRADLAFSFMQALGLEDEAQARAAAGSGSVGVPTYTETFSDIVVIGTAGTQAVEGVDYVDITFTTRGTASSVTGTLNVGETAPDLDLLLMDSNGNVLDRSETETSDEQVSASVQGDRTYVYRVVGWLNGPAPVDIVSEQVVAPADANGVTETTVIDLEQAPEHTHGHILLAIERGIMPAYPAEVVQQDDGSFLALPGPRFEPNVEVTRAAFADNYSRWREEFFAAVGLTIKDPSGDQTGTAAHDIVSAIFEYDEATRQIVYTLELADLSVRLPNDYWNMEHSFGNTVVFVSALITETAGERYRWGTIVMDPQTGLSNQTSRGAPSSGRIEGNRIIIRLDVDDVAAALGHTPVGRTSTGTSANSFELLGTSVTGGLLLFTDRASGLDFRLGGC